MKTIRFALAALLACWTVCGQAAEGKDVPYVPTPQVVVDEMLRLAGASAADYIIDLGSGDGRILVTAAQRFGARGHGVEIDDTLLAESLENAERAGVADRVQFRREDLFQTDLAPATLITMYLVPRVNRRLQPRLERLVPGTRIVSHDFDLEGWRPDARSTVRKNLFLWIVPADVSGRWRVKLALPGGVMEREIAFRQRHQDVDGMVHGGPIPTQVWQPALAGERFTFVLVDDRDRDDEAGLYVEARVRGGVMEGRVTRGVGASAMTLPWRAERVAR